MGHNSGRKRTGQVGGWHGHGEALPVQLVGRVGFRGVLAVVGGIGGAVPAMPYTL